MQDAAVRNRAEQDGTVGLLGHNALLQQATGLPADGTDRYGRLRHKGTAVPLWEDLKTLDNPFYGSLSGVGQAQRAGMHFVPSSLPAACSTGLAQRWTG